MQKEHLTIKDVCQFLGKSRRAAQRIVSRESWQQLEEGSGLRLFPITGLPARRQTEAVRLFQVPDHVLPALAPDAQKVHVAAHEPAPEIVPLLCPEAQAVASRRFLLIYRSAGGALDFGSSRLTEKILSDPNVAARVEVVNDALAVPAGWSKRAWTEAVALKHGKSPATVYREVQKFRSAGLPGLAAYRDRGLSAWSPEALDFFEGLYLRQDHDKLTRRRIYDATKAEAALKGWRVGDYSGALKHLKARVTPALEAFRSGGRRELDNALPPILRNYADLCPFQLIVGDQHRHDLWVRDDQTGDIFRPESYVWQDLRTRIIYGGAVARHYDAELMLVARWMGAQRFGLDGGTFNDHGGPEESQRNLKVAEQLCLFGVYSSAEVAKHRRFAKVRNAKSKMIERTFRAIESLFANEFGAPGVVPRLTDSQEAREVDQERLKKLRDSGKLWTFSEFCANFYRVIEFYNAVKPHAGVLAEWKWPPRPQSATPYDCLAACYQFEGWRPKMLPDDALTLIFLPTETRKIDRGRIRFRNQIYENPALLELVDSEVTVRFNPLDLSSILVFRKGGGDFVCRAEPVVYSSMIDGDLAREKIREKARLQKIVMDQYRKLTAPVPILQQYSTVPRVEKITAQVRETEKRAASEVQGASLVLDELQIQKEVRRMEETLVAETEPRLFHSERDRYQWLIEQLAKGRRLNESDREFLERFEIGLAGDSLDYWSHYKFSLGLPKISGGEQIDAEGRIRTDS